MGFVCCVKRLCMSTDTEVVVYGNCAKMGTASVLSVATGLTSVTHSRTGTMSQARLPHTVAPSVIYLFFLIGVISAISFRALIIFTHVHPEWFRPVWYLGTVGYVIFFLYRYWISQKRKRAIRQYDLLNKLKGPGELTGEEREVLVYLLSSLAKSREDLNYLFIFFLSIFAVAADLLLS